LVIDVVHEDPGLVVVNKPEGIASIPERDPKEPSVRRLLESERGERLWVVHRLDKEVSGALVFARSADTHRALCRAFELRQVKKTYLAVTQGRVALEHDLIDMPIRQFGSGRMGVDERGKPSRTAFRVLMRGEHHCLLEVEPETGRRHQIRVHLYAIEHPLLGETRYGKSAPGPVPRLMLHAWKLVLPGLVGEPERAFVAPPPRSFLAELSARGLGLALG
jgi:RluA family pseudouridine synthase